jgi:hypothetical protein
LYLVELSIFDSVLARKRPSNVAAAATIAAINRLDMHLPETKAQLINAVTTYTTTRFGDLSFLQRRLELTSNEVPDNDQKNIRPHVVLDDDEYQVPSTATRILPMVSDPDLTTM